MDEAYDKLTVFINELVNKYNLSYDDLCWILFQLATNYYFKSIALRNLKEEGKDGKQF
jgi:hypothetical protein